MVRVFRRTIEDTNVSFKNSIRDSTAHFVCFDQETEAKKYKNIYSYDDGSDIGVVQRLAYDPFYDNPYGAG